MSSCKTDSKKLTENVPSQAELNAALTPTQRERLETDTELFGHAISTHPPIRFLSCSRAGVRASGCSAQHHAGRRK